MTTTTRTTRALLAAVLLGPALLQPAAHAATDRPARETCGGEVATIVARTPGTSLQGTPGPDVIISRGGTVDAGRGADVICLRGRGSVKAGPGDDRVLVTTGRGSESAVDLGAGRDVLRGGNGSETVKLNGPDVVSTGGGRDRAYTSGGPVFQGRLDLGRGVDELQVAAYDRAAPSARIAGGPGRDRFVVYEISDDVVIDNRRHRATQATAAPFASGWSSFEVFRPHGYIPEDGDAVFDLRFVGTPAAEDLDATEATVVRATMGRGTDRVSVFGVDDDTVVDGGGQPGDHLAQGLHGGKLTVDLQAGRATATGGLVLPTTTEATVRGFTHLLATASEVTVVGTTGADLLRVVGCTASVAGGRGDDTITFGSPGPFTCDDDTGASRLDGQAGHDTLVGSDATDDTLVGGPGRDRGDGRGGDDTCTVERAVRCEA